MMAEIDELLASMTRRGVQRVLMAGGQPMRVYLKSGEMQGAVIASPKLQGLVREILPSDLRPKMDQTGRFEFTHRTPEGSFDVSVARQDEQVQVEITLVPPASTTAPPAPAAAPRPNAAAPAPRDWSPLALPAPQAHGSATAIVALAASPTSEVLASASSDGAIYVWSVEQSKRTLTLSQPSSRSAQPGAGGAVGAARSAAGLAFSHDGRLVAGTASGVAVWDARTGIAQAKIPGASGANGVAFSPDASALAYSVGARADLWDLAKKKAARSYGPRQSALSVAFSGDGRWLAVGDARGVSLADLNAKPGALSSLQKSLARGGKSSPFAYSIDVGGAVDSLSFSPRGSGLAVNAGGQCALIDIATQRTLWKQRQDGMSAVAFAPGGAAIAAANADGGVYFFDWASGAPCRERLAVSTSPVTALAFSGGMLACGCADGTLCAWRLF